MKGDILGLDALISSNSELDINFIDETSQLTPIMIAACYNQVEIVTRLLKLGCDIFVSNIYGFNLFTYAVIYQRIKLIAFIYQHLTKSKQKLLSPKHMSKISSFIDQTTKYKDQTPYFYACRIGNKQLIETLIDICKVDITRQDCDNYRGSAYITNDFSLKKSLEKQEEEAYRISLL